VLVTPRRAQILGLIAGGADTARLLAVTLKRTTPDVSRELSAMEDARLIVRTGEVRRDGVGRPVMVYRVREQRA
jgi:predicted ArsR family transcriptional regulator